MSINSRLLATVRLTTYLTAMLFSLIVFSMIRVGLYLTLPVGSLGLLE